MKVLHIPVLLCSCIRRALYNVEKDLRFVQDQAGHASPTTTAIYAKTNNKARRRQHWMRKIFRRISNKLKEKADSISLPDICQDYITY